MWTGGKGMPPIDASVKGDTVTIAISDRFDINLCQRFSECFREYPVTHKFIIDLNNTDYLDSSGLGSMIALHHYVIDAGGKVMITGANDAVIRILKMANFEQLFDIA